VKIRATIAILLANCLIAAPARAAEMLIINGRYVTISGVIKPKDATKFLDLVWERRTPTTVILDSPGGLIAEAAWIGHIIRVRQWETLVQRDSTCNSACPLIWLGGVNRALESRLGFHTAIRPPAGSGIRDDASNAYMGKYMSSMGAPQDLVDLQSKADPCCFNYVDIEKAKAWGLLGPQLFTRRTDLEADAWLNGLRNYMDLKHKLEETARAMRPVHRALERPVPQQKR
jgi:hypothetical protein